MRIRKMVAGLLFCLIATSSLTFAQIQSVRDAASAFINETTFLGSAARTASGDSGNPIDLAAYSTGVILVNVTAVSGTSPSLTVNFQSCMDSGTTKCVTVKSGTAITATGTQAIQVNMFGRYNRISTTISGTTPSFTFEVYGAFKPTG